MNDQTENEIRSAVQKVAQRAAEPEFTLTRMGEFIAKHGREQQERTREFARDLLDAERRKLAYLEAVVGEIAKETK